MRILLTNDDGIESAGITALRAALEPEHELWVVAPESNRSGTSHSVTLSEASRLRRRGERVWAASGTPVDCVIVAILGLVPHAIDLVLSGINHGPNLGTDIVYSGTAGAAREAALHGVPAVALSLCRHLPPLDFAPAASFVAENVRELRRLWSRGSYLNVNFPSDGSRYQGVELTRPCVREYHDRMVSYQSPRGDLYCFLTGEAPSAEPEGGSDFAAVAHGRVSISLLSTEPGGREAPAPELHGLRLAPETPKRLIP